MSWVTVRLPLIDDSCTETCGDRRWQLYVPWGMCRSYVSILGGVCIRIGWSMLKRSIVVSSPSTFNGVCEDVGLQSVVGLHSTVFPAVLGG